MYKVIWIDEKQNNQEIRFNCLDLAMNHAKELNLFVQIVNSETNFTLVGKFGVDSIKDGVCPDGVEYSWRKRRL